MQKPSPLPRLIPCLLLAALLATGCSPRPVQVLAVRGPDSLRTSQPGTFEAETNEEAKPPVMFDWTFADGNTAEGNPATHAFDRPGNYTVTVTASNRKGKSRDTGQTSVVVFTPPVPAQIVTLLAEPTDPDTRTAVRFSANVRGDTPLSYAWSFGDGATGSGTTPTHTYDEPGIYTVSLRLSNKAGDDQRTMSLTVSPYEAAYCAELVEMNAALFDRNASVLTPSAEQALRENLTILQDCPNVNVRVEGQAGPFERNPQRLSEDRARVVEQFYTGRGVAAGRITSIGKGRVGQGTKKSGSELFQRADTIPLRGM